MNIKTETWNGHTIRFVEKAPGDWRAMAKDVTDALDYKNSRDAITQHCRWVAKCYVPHPQNEEKAIEVNVIPEKDIYRIAFRSEQPDALEFQDWICDVLVSLRQSSDLEAFQVFRLLDKEHQKEAMRNLSASLTKPVRVNFIKTNTIADKAVSTKHGHAKMLKKAQMTPEMLLDRQPILDDTVQLMAMNDRFGLGLSVSDTIYRKYCQ